MEKLNIGFIDYYLVPHEQTIDIISIRAAGLKAMDHPYEWVLV